jgi:hypothetical protein
MMGSDSIIRGGGLHPADALPESGRMLVEFDSRSARLEAVFSTPSGVRTMVGRE